MGKKIEIPKWLEGLPLAPEFRPTDTEFADPITYISKIEKQASSFGICKVIPPLPKPSKKYVFGNLNRCLSREPESDGVADGVEQSLEDRGGKGSVGGVFTTRQQELGYNGKKSKGGGNVQQPSAQKQVWQSGEVYTLEQFELKSKTFSRSVLGGTKDISPLTVEAAFWKAASEKPIYIEYANDLPGSAFAEPEGVLQYIHRRSNKRKRVFPRKYLASSDLKEQDKSDSEKSCGSILNPSSDTGVELVGVPASSADEAPQQPRQGTEQSSGQMEGTSGWRLSNSPWNLQVISRSAGSLTRFMLDDIPGVTSPMVYIGMLFSWFAWHVEDHELHSLNFLHTGAPKTWYAVPGTHASVFEEVIRTQAYGGEIDHLGALTVLGEKTTLLSPQVVVAAGIPCCRLVQNPGEFVVTFPRAYHIGFSHGFNCGEAANFGTPQWLSVAKDAALRRAAMDHLPMLSHQQLLCLLTMSFVSRVPRSLLPGARSSRLRNRHREERELSVKKAFICDMLNENKLLNILIGRNSHIRAVLWDADSLPPSHKLPPDQSGVAIITNKAPSGKPFDRPKTNDHQHDTVGPMSSYLETINDLYSDDDISREFQVDSGALVCVACGILGFPFMSVVQPSSETNMVKLSASHAPGAGAPEVVQPMASSEPSNLQNSSNDCVSDSVETLHKRWNISDEFLRPRILCLEHAVQTEDMLRPNGGANMLVICHSDYPKIKANAVAVSEEIAVAFDYEDVATSSASVEDLSLINLAIDDEEHVQQNEDWTSMLGINLQYCVKARKASPSKQMKHPFFPEGFFSHISSVSRMSSSNWHCKRSRSRRGPGHTAKTSENIHSNSDGSLEGRFGESRSTNETEILQYSLRKWKTESRDATKDQLRGPSTSQGHATKDQLCANKNPPNEITAGDCIDSSASTKDPMAFDLDKSADQQNSVVFQICDAEPPAEGNSVITESSEPLELVSSVSSVQRTLSNVESLPEIQSSGEMNVVEDAWASKDSECSVVMTADIAVDAGTGERKRTLDVDTSAFSSIDTCVSECRIEKEGDLTVHDDLAENQVCLDSFQETAAGVAAIGDVEKNVISECSDIAISSGTDKPDHHPLLDKPGMDMSTDCADYADQELPSIVEVECDSKPDPADRTLEFLSNQDSDCNRPAHQIICNVMKDFQSGFKETQRIDGCIVYTRSTLRLGNKRKQAASVDDEGAKQDNGFIRSPCEGLRSRTKKQHAHDRTECTDGESAPQKLLNKRGNRVSGSSKNSNKKEKKPSQGPYRCDIDSCNMRFETRLELSLHKRNRCPADGCGKRFRSHRYVVVHQRVHEKDRPLKCTWKGCSKTFKWAWARTEHLRLHTGERPYECSVEGCGLTFRFVSDYNRHRRKTGHYVDPYA
ncbi:hypothetical protein Droror1_Dr00016833 [Drosera rotundifolia]